MVWVRFSWIILRVGIFFVSSRNFVIVSWLFVVVLESMVISLNSDIRNTKFEVHSLDYKRKFSFNA